MNEEHPTENQDSLEAGILPEHPAAQHEIELRALRQALVEARQGLAVTKINHRLATRVGGLKGVHPDQLASEVKRHVRMVAELEGLISDLLSEPTSVMPVPSGLEVVSTQLEVPPA